MSACHCTRRLREVEKSTEPNLMNFEVGFLHEFREVADHEAMLTFCGLNCI
jgi:hypothetical protein